MNASDHAEEVGTQSDPTPVLRDLVRFATLRSAFYRDLYANIDISALSKVDELPIIDQEDFWEANSIDANRVLTEAHRDGVVFKTGGTTSRPKMTVYTRDEVREIATLQGNGYANAGMRPGDRVANLFYAGSLYASFLFNVMCLHECAVPVVHIPIGGDAKPAEMVGMLREQNATVLLGTPTTATIAAAAMSRQGVQMPEVHLFLFGGEAFYDDQETLFRKAFPNAAIRSLGYASVDAGVIAAPVEGECDHRVHQVHSASKIVEIVDEVTGEPIREIAVTGRLIVTDLTRRLMPMIRYPVGDRAEWTDLSRQRIRLQGRSEEGARIGPVTVVYEDIRELVREVLRGYDVAGVQLIQRRRETRDQLVVRIAATVGDREKMAARLTAELAIRRPMFFEHVARGLIASAAFEFVGTHELLVNSRSGKLIRVIDERM